MSAQAPAPTQATMWGLEHCDAAELIARLVERFHPRLYLACSFQKESAVLLDLLLRVQSGARVFTIDTGLLFPETYATWVQVEHRYGITIDVYQGPSLALQASRHGPDLWARDPDRCCGLRKVDPVGDALRSVDAWITGLRRSQSPLRRSASKIEWDARHGVWKANPLADWTDDQVWRYIRERELPYNPLHDRGYGSIGCVHCTVPGPGREGRWAGTDKRECGLHGPVRRPGESELSSDGG